MSKLMIVLVVLLSLAVAGLFLVKHENASDNNTTSAIISFDIVPAPQDADGRPCVSAGKTATPRDKSAQ